MSGKDLVKVFKRLGKREKRQAVVGKIMPVDVPEVDDSMQVDEGVVNGAVEIVPVPDVSRDTVLVAGTTRAATSSLAMPPPKLPGAASNDPSIISKKLCDIKLPGFAVNSKLYVRFRKIDDKVFTADLLVRMDKFKTIADANDAILKLVKDGMVKDLNSLEVDSKFVLIADKSLILMSLPDAIELLHRIDVHTIVKDIIMPGITGAAASDAVQDVIMAPIEGDSASDAVQDVAMPLINGDSASEVLQSVIMSPVAVSIMIPSVVAKTRIRIRIRMRKVHASVFTTISGFENLGSRNVRQVESGQVDEKGDNVGGKWAVADGVSAFTGDSAENCAKWVRNPKNVSKEIAKSLSYIDTGHSSVSLIALIKYSVQMNRKCQSNVPNSLLYS